MAKRRRPQVWDKEAIKAEIWRRGKTLLQLAVEYGFHSSTTRQALIRPCFTGEQVIAHFLDVPAPELWPDRYDADGKPLHPRARQWERSTGRMAPQRGEAA